MKKACSYCGLIHDLKFECTKKTVHIYKGYAKKRDSREEIFRSSYEWKKKRTHILKRDKYLCQACLHGLHGTSSRLTASGLSVHHIVPLKADFDLRLDDGNLITLCQAHHELAERGRITADILREITPPYPDESGEQTEST